MAIRSKTSELVDITVLREASISSSDTRPINVIHFMDYTLNYFQELFSNNKPINQILLIHETPLQRKRKITLHKYTQKNIYVHRIINVGFRLPIVMTHHWRTDENNYL